MSQYCIPQVMVLAFFLSVCPRAGYAVGTFISAPDRVDMVYDDNRELLYISSGERVLRYDMKSDEFLAPFTLGGTLRGMDISQDGNTLAVANSQADNGKGVTYLIDLPTSETKAAVYDLRFYDDEGPGSVAFCSDGGLLIASGGQWGDLYRYDPEAETAVSIASSFRHRSMLCASADGSVVGFAEGNISDGAFGRYRTSDGDVLRKNGYSDGTSWFNYEIGTNRNGSQYAIPTYGGTFIYDANLVKTGTTIGTYAAGQPIGVVYSPVEDVVYFAWVGSSNVYAYDTNTFQRIASYDFESEFDNNGNRAYVEGRLKISGNGKLLFGTVDGGVRYVKFSAPPVADPQSVTLDEDSQVTITLTASDPDNDAISYSIKVQPANGYLTGDGPDFVYTPKPDFAGPDSFLFEASDGDQVSTAALVSINVNGIPDAPWAESKTVTINEGESAEVILHATDAEGDPLTFRLISDPIHGTLSGDIPNLTYEPDAGFNSNDQFQFVANDGSEDSAPGIIDIVVITDADRPVANPQSLSVAEDSFIDITLTGTDPNGDDLEFTIINYPSHGSLYGDAPYLTYKPLANYNGSDSFTFKTNDGNADSTVATVALTVIAGEDAPVAVSQSLSTTEDSPIAITLDAVDGDDTELDFSIVTQPVHGTLSGEAPFVTYTPFAGFHGPDSFQFTAGDGTSVSPPATISIVIGEVNDAPVATSLRILTSRKKAISFILPASDADGDELEYLLKSLPVNGTLSGVLPNLTYTPSKKFEGKDSFTFKVEDGSMSAVATVEILVAGKNQKPTAEGQLLFTDADTALSVLLSGNSAIDAPLAYEITKAPKHGTLDGVAPNVVYTPDAGYTGKDILKFKVLANGEKSKTAKVRIVVGGTK